MNGWVRKHEQAGQKKGLSMACVDDSCSSRLSKFQHIYMQLLPKQRFKTDRSGTEWRHRLLSALLWLQKSQLAIWAAQEMWWGLQYELVSPSSAALQRILARLPGCVHLGAWMQERPLGRTYLGTWECDYRQIKLVLKWLSPPPPVKSHSELWFLFLKCCTTFSCIKWWQMQGEHVSVGPLQLSLKQNLAPLWGHSRKNSQAVVWKKLHKARFPLPLATLC